jgi:hypothetical protein
MAEIRIKIGASVDRGLENAFRPVEESAKRARNTVKNEIDRGKADELRAYKQAAKEKEKVLRDEVRAAQKAERDKVRASEKAWREANQWEKAALKEKSKARADDVRAAQKAERDKVRASEKAWREANQWEKAALKEKSKARADDVREHERAEREKLRTTEKAERARATAEKQRHREEERQRAKHEREEKRAANEVVRGQMQAAREITRFSSNAGRTIGRAGAFAGGIARKGASFGAGILRDVATGSGVNLALASHVEKNVDLEKRAVDLSNAAYMPGKGGQAGQRQGPAKIMQEVRAVSRATATDANAAMEGLQKFVAKTGDLETGRAVIMDMARYSRATGAELDDMADAAGDVASALGDTPNKAEKVKAVMKAIAAQGKEGAVEIKDLATQMAKVGAAAGQFTGSSADNIAKMGAITQAARAKGGAASPTQAAQSTLGFMSTFSKAARQNKFKEYGVNIRAEDGKIADPKQIILDSITAAASKKHGGMANFDKNIGAMFMDASSKRATRAFESVYKETSGTHEDKIKAVSEYFDNLAKATMEEKEVTDSFNRSMQTTEAQAQLANAEFRTMVQELQTGVTPALKALVPIAVDAGTGIAILLKSITGVSAKEGAAADDAAYKGTQGSRAALEAALKEQPGADGKRTISKELLDKAKADAVELAGREQAGRDEVENLKKSGKANSLDWKNPLGSAAVAGYDILSGNSGKRQGEIKQAEERNERQHAELVKMNALMSKLIDGSLGVVVKNMPKDGIRPPGVSDSGRSPQTTSDK